MDPQTGPVRRKPRYLGGERRPRLPPAGSSPARVGAVRACGQVLPAVGERGEGRRGEREGAGGREAAGGERRGGAPLLRLPARPGPLRSPPSPVLPPLSRQPQHKLRQPEPAASRGRCPPKGLSPALPAQPRGSAGLGRARAPPARGAGEQRGGCYRGLTCRAGPSL